MRPFDFLIYFTALYYTKNANLLSWSTAVERACYVVSIVSGFWLMTIWVIVNIVRKQFVDLQTVPIIIATIAMLFLFQYIYVTRGRYDVIASKDYKEFKMPYNRAVIVTFTIYILSLLLPFALATYIGLTTKH